MAMNPALWASIAACAANRVEYPTPGPAITRTSEFDGYSWIDRIRLKRLKRLLSDDAQRRALRQPVDEARNEKRWARYFAILEKVT